jgi:hypothetical protein
VFLLNSLPEQLLQQRCGVGRAEVSSDSAYEARTAVYTLGKNSILSRQFQELEAERSS